MILDKYGTEMITEDGELGKFISNAEIEEMQKNEILRREIAASETKKKRNGISFVNWINDSAYKTITENFTDFQLGKLMRIAIECPIEYDTSRLIYGNKREPITEKELWKKIKLDGNKNKMNRKRSKDKCLEFDIIRFEDDGIYFNNNILMKGSMRKMNNSNVVSMIPKYFKKYEKLSDDDLALLYKLQNYIHREKLYLCYNPEAKTYEEAKPIRTVVELANVLGMSRDKLYRKVNKLKINNRYVFVQVKAGVKNKFFINDQAFFRGQYSIFHDSMIEEHGKDKYNSLFEEE